MDTERILICTGCETELVVYGTWCGDYGVPCNVCDSDEFIEIEG